MRLCLICLDIQRARCSAPTLSKSHRNKFTRAGKVRVLYISHLLFFQPETGVYFWPALLSFNWSPAQDNLTAPLHCWLEKRLLAVLRPSSHQLNGKECEKPLTNGICALQVWPSTQHTSLTKIEREMWIIRIKLTQKKRNVRNRFSKQKINHLRIIICIIDSFQVCMLAFILEKKNVRIARKFMNRRDCFQLY